VIDRAVHQLYTTGYLHNHARMWLASYIVHLRKVHWRVGADWMVGYLLDGDLASNHLSWQWVAATFSNKPYLFNAENVARYVPWIRSRGRMKPSIARRRWWARTCPSYSQHLPHSLPHRYRVPIVFSWYIHGCWLKITSMAYV